MLDMVEVTTDGPGYVAGAVGCAVDRLEHGGEVAWIVELEGARDWEDMPTVPETALRKICR
ncbi:MAG: hypothetical protein K1X67_01550 [Fimbriimonadaceae bacterium]|nr:hypothetical protein [Fimbriimonadaceae bacterium]